MKIHNSSITLTYLYSASCSKCECMGGGRNVHGNSLPLDLEMMRALKKTKLNIPLDEVLEFNSG